MTDDRMTIWVAVVNDKGQIDLVSTGLRGFVDEEGDFIIPYQDDMTAEEVCRLITAQVKRMVEG